MSEVSHPEERDFKAAVKNGLALKCPNCSEGPLLYKYLKVHDHCPNCNEALYHQRADDGPAYLTILVVAHLVGLLTHILMTYANLSNLALFFALSSFALVLSLFILPRMKGMMIAIQWAKRMNGF